MSSTPEDLERRDVVKGGYVGDDIGLKFDRERSDRCMKPDRITVPVVQAVRREVDPVVTEVEPRRRLEATEEIEKSQIGMCLVVLGRKRITGPRANGEQR